MGCPSRIARAFVCAATLVLCAPANLHADEGTEDPIAWLEVSKSPEASDCPDAADLAKRVAQISGQSALAVSATPTTRLSLRVDLTKNKAGYVAVLRAKGSRTGVRNIADIGDDCSGLADALAVTLAIIIDDERSTPPPAPRATDSFPSTPHAAPPAIVPSRPPETQPTSRQPPYFRPFVGAAAAIGILDESAVGATAGLDVQVDRLVTGVSVLWLPPHRFDRSPGNATIDLIALGFHGCFQPQTDPRQTRLALCVHFTEGVLRGKADGFSLNGSATRPWTAPGVGAIVSGEVVAPLEWFARTELFVPLRRERFVIDNLGTIHETPILGGLVSVGLALRIE